MDQVKIGRFIAELRKEKGLTQAQLAEHFEVSNKAVSKWETGKSLPDASIMIDLCNLLGITVNELLSGERISMEDYKEKAEEHLVEIHKKKTRFQRTALLGILFGAVTNVIWGTVFTSETSNFAVGIAVAVGFSCCGCLLGYVIDKKHAEEDE